MKRIGIPLDAVELLGRELALVGKLTQWLGTVRGPKDGIIMWVARPVCVGSEVALSLLNAMKATHVATLLHDRLLDERALNLNVWRALRCFGLWLLGRDPFVRLPLVGRKAGIHVDLEGELVHRLKFIVDLILKGLELFVARGELAALRFAEFLVFAADGFLERVVGPESLDLVEVHFDGLEPLDRVLVLQLGVLREERPTRLAGPE